MQSSSIRVQMEASDDPNTPSLLFEYPLLSKLLESSRTFTTYFAKLRFRCIWNEQAFAYGIPTVQSY